MGARQRRDVLASTDAELARTEAAVDRYMHAFENGTVTEEMFGDRVRELGRKAQTLRARRADLAAEAAADEAPVPAAEDLEELRVQLVSVAETRLRRGDGAGEGPQGGRAGVRTQPRGGGSQPRPAHFQDSIRLDGGRR